ncbi:PAS domain S-box protein [Polaromonas sp.]|uniref:PAS domain S-box protein n=1 Tax=Polaromonas sp. TaxID=1869339 RepID=UPI00180BA6D9|nr:PAS domain S-box protein [Polaromonas sp.]NMM07954.1 PAS domain S-box protein [Polaromonas sp.]
MTHPRPQTDKASSDAELRSRTDEVNCFNRTAAGRELRMIELENEVNELCQRHGEAERYPFASRAYQAVESLGALDQRRAALKRMDEPVHSPKAAQRLNSELRESTDRYGTILESMDDGFCIVEKVLGEADELLDFRYVEANPAFVAQSGANDAAGVVGKTIRQLFPGISEDWFATYDTVLRTGESLRFERELIPGERVLELFVFQVAVKTHRGLAIIFKDITKRKHAEEALRDSEAFNRSIIKSSPDCIKVLDLEGNLLSMLSGQELLGIEDIQPFLNTSWIDFWKDGDRAAARAAIHAALAGGKGNFVGFFRTPLGQPKWWDMVISPILDLNGKPARLLAVSRDVTQRRQAEMNLAFLASVSQDLVRWANVDEMMQTVGAKMAGHLQLSLCAFAEINETAKQVVINHDWHSEHVPGLVGVHRLADFVEDEFIRVARAGEVIVVRNTAADPRTEPGKFAALKIASFLCVPLIQDGQWRFALCLYKSVAYDWREDEIALTRELTARIWTRLERLRAEAALRESEQRYRTLFESIDEGFCIIEKVEDDADALTGEARAPLDFRYIEANAAFEVQSGVFDVVGKTIRQVVPGITDDWLLTYDAVLRTGKSTRFERELLDKGRVRELEVCTFRVQAKTRACVAVIFKDVTARKQAEQALLQRTAQFKTLIDEAPLGIYMIDADFRIRQANPTALPAFGNIPDLIGRDFAEVLHILWPKAWADANVKKFRHTLETGEPSFVPEMIEERADRQTTEYYEWQINRIALPEGGFGVVCYFRDISRRVLAQQQIRESEERYRSLFNSMDEGFCIIEMIFDEHDKPIDYRFLEVNPPFEKLTGLQDARGKRIREFTHDQEEYWFEIYGKVALTGEAIRFVNEAKSLNRWFDVYAFQIGDPASRKVAILFNNITERKKSERQLQEHAETLADLDRRKDEFLAMLSHELRNPLAPISNAVHLLRLHKNEDPVQQQARAIIERQVGQLNHLVDDLLEVSRITTGRVQLRRQQVALGGIVERAVETAQPLIAQRRHELTVSLPPQPIWLHADASRLEQVVVNLLTNAAKYTDEGGGIGLSVQQDGDNAVLRVRDSGIGIAPELLPCIFELFTQAERSLDRSQGGLGIGLCLVQRLVELHGGTVAVHSVLGHGSEFTVRLPLALACLPPSPSPLIDAVRPNSNHYRVLVVDDNVDTTQSLGDLLSLSGHEIQLAHDGPAAVAAAIAWRPDVVLLDIGLPGFSGFEVAKRIRQETTLRNIVLVALTGYGKQVDRQRSQDTGFDHHLVKPADFEEVEKILASLPQKAT